MKKLWISMVSVVFAIAAFKTILVAKLFLAPELVNFAVVSGLFSLFSILTGGVAYVAVSKLKSYLEYKHLQRLTPGSDETASKEEIIRRYAQVWALSNAELDVAVFAAKGFSNNEIADMRGSTLATIKTQLSQVFKKSGLENRYQLMAFVTDEVCVMASRTESVEELVKAAKDSVQAVKNAKVVPMVGKRRAPLQGRMTKQVMSTG